MSVSFNQDGGCLAVATANGFRICNVSPYQETFRRVLASSAASPAGGGAIGTVAMLFRCNLLCLTGGGAIRSLHTNANFYCPPNKVLIWDDHLGRCIGELSFRQCVLAVKLRRDRIAVALRDRVYVYNFSDLNVLDKIYTSDNPNGLLQISTEVSSSSAGAGSSSGSSANSSGMVLACPSVTPGQVRVELYGMRKTVVCSLLSSACLFQAFSSCVAHCFSLWIYSIYMNLAADRCARVEFGSLGLDCRWIALGDGFGKGNCHSPL